MKSGYKVLWTDLALEELAQTIEYLEENWTEKDIKNFSAKLEKTIVFISKNPNLFQSSDIKKEIRRAVVSKHNTLYYRVINDCVEVISFFSNRQNPKKRKLQ